MTTRDDESAPLAAAGPIPPTVGATDAGPDLATPATPPGGPNLAARAARGAFVTLAGQGIRILLQVASVVVLARLLEPRDYGLLAVVLVLVGIGEIFRDFGLTNAAVQAPELTRRQQSGLFWVNTGIGVVLCVLLVVLSPFVALAFGQPALAPIARVLALTFVINGLAAQYRAHLTRELRFGRLALADVVGQAIGLGLSIALAVLGAGHWALVAQQLAQLGVALVLVVAFSGWWPGLPRRHSGVGEFLRFGSNLAGTQIVYYASNNLDTLTIAVRFSSVALGLYNRSFQLLMTPLNQLRAPATTVALPILSRMRDDYERAGEYLKRGQLAFGYSIVPVLAVVVGSPGPVVALFLGPRWTSVRPILALLAVAAGAQLLAYVAFWVYLSRGLGRQLMRYTMLALVLQAVCIVVGSTWGVVGVAAGYATAACLEWPMSLVWISRITPVPTRALLTGAGRIVICAVLAGLGAAAVTHGLGTAPAAVVLVASIGAAGCVYGLVALVSARIRRDLVEVADFARRMVQRNSLPQTG